MAARLSMMASKMPFDVVIGGGGTILSAESGRVVKAVDAHCEPHRLRETPRRRQA
jgi:hypothetical protein